MLKSCEFVLLCVLIALVALMCYRCQTNEHLELPANYALCPEIHNKQVCASKTNCKWKCNKCRYYGDY